MRSFFRSLRTEKDTNSSSSSSSSSSRPYRTPLPFSPLPNSSNFTSENYSSSLLDNYKFQALDKKQEAALEEQKNDAVEDAPPAYDYTGPPSYPPPPITDSNRIHPPSVGGLGILRSPANNATDSEYQQGVTFCQAYQLNPPMQNVPTELLAATNNELVLAPLGYLHGVRVTNGYEEKGTACQVVGVQTTKDCPDTTLFSKKPLYFAAGHHPSMTPAAIKGYKTVIYYEVNIISLSSSWNRKTGETPAMAIGYAAAPYPGFRLPGWHRGSLGVHSDDGHRYCNDCLGGIQFTTPFKTGEKIGLGLVFSYSIETSGIDKVDAEVVFTRNGMKAGSWMVNEELDANRLRARYVDGIIDPKHGLMGDTDIYAAVGVSGEGIDLSVKFFSPDSDAARQAVLGRL